MCGYTVTAPGEVLCNQTCAVQALERRGAHTRTHRALLARVAGKRVGHAFLVPCAKFMNVYHSIRVLCVYACAECNT